MAANSARFDVAMLSIGAYEPRWMMRYPHMNPAEGLQAFHDLGARRMIPMHWGTFDLTDEPIDHPPRVLRSAHGEDGRGCRPRQGDGGRREVENPVSY